MQGKLLLVAGLAVGYVLGARRGREGYDKLKRQASETWRSPNVQRTVSSARKFAEDNIPVVGDAISDAVKKVNDAATETTGSSTSASSGASDGSATSGPPRSTPPTSGNV
ncbi:MAG: hypothetical protein JWP85_309 [Rhodoglobus sp.]|nr:hypothetical protein [Rhodoglobus sp.]